MRATFGFGDALVAMPLLTLVIGIRVATPIVALMSVTISLAIIWGNWRDIDMRAAWRLVAAAMVGVPAGVWLLNRVPEQIVIGLLALSLVGFGLYSIVKPSMPTVRNHLWVYFFGFLAGCLGGAYNTHGPPVLIYGTLQDWSPVRFRATLQGFFFPVGLIVLASHGLGGLWSDEVFSLYALALLPMLAAIYAGSELSRRISPARFHRLVHLIIIGLGALLLVQII